MSEAGNRVSSFLKSGGEQMDRINKFHKVDIGLSSCPILLILSILSISSETESIGREGLAGRSRVARIMPAPF